MSIRFIENRRVFHLQSKKMSYVMEIGADELLHHVYWGARLDQIPPTLYNRAPYRRAKLIEGQPADSVKRSLEFFRYECPTYGTGDFRLPALDAVESETGSAILDLRYASHRITDGALPAEGLPSIHGNSRVQTLTVVLKDPLTGLQAELNYRLIEDKDILVRNMRIFNAGGSPMILRSVMSASLDFEDGDMQLMTFNGCQLREFTPDIRSLSPGIAEIGSTRGSSSHQHVPHAVLLRPGTDGIQGEAYSISMMYGGNWTIRTEIDPHGTCRLQCGIHPQNFSWKLCTGEYFETPEAVLTWSDAGLNGLSDRLHPFVREHLLRGNWANRTRPLLLNTWEACYFDVNESRIANLADHCAKAGVELLVLDDGWFGHRDQANCSLGDWHCSAQKFPHGLDVLADSLAKKGLRLGIWVEPEMVSPDSDLYRAHPDWCLHADGRLRTEWRNQLVLDLSRSEVVDFLIASLDSIFGSGKIAYVKWDMNRRLTEVGSSAWPADRQGEIFHRYMLGLYRILEHMVQTYPNLLMENCASGGGRYDYGMYHYFHQGWLSDNSDAVCRLSMQTAASIFYPSEVITSHVSVCPNHQIGRTTPLTFRRDTAALFNAGYELNPEALSEKERGAMADMSVFFKEVRETVHHGRFVRLNRNLIGTDWYGWMVIGENKVIAGYYRDWCKPEAAYWRAPLYGLQPDVLYRNEADGITLSGSDWMHIGWMPDWHEGDCFSQILILQPVGKEDFSRECTV